MISRKLLIAFVAPLLVDGIAAAQSDEIDRARKAVEDEAIRRALADSIRFLPRYLSPLAEMSGVMLDDERAHQRRTQSEHLIFEREREKLRRAVPNQLAVLVKNLKIDFGPAIERQRQEIDRAIDSVLATEFGKRYGEARQQAVETQRAKLAKVVNPQPLEIERVAGPDILHSRHEQMEEVASERGGSLVETYVERAARGQAVFDENREELRKQAVQAVRRGLEELWRQLNTVRNHDGGGAIEFSAIRARIADALNRIAQDYPVFPSVKVALETRAAEQEAYLFHRYVRDRLRSDNEKTPPCPGLHDRVARVFPASFAAAEPDPGKHLSLLLQQLRGYTRDLLIDGYVGAVKDAKTRQTFQQRLAASISRPGGDLEFDNAFRACLEGELNASRRRLAEAELTETWPALANLSLELDDQSLKKLSLGQAGIDEESLLHSRGWRLKETYKIFSDRRSSLLAEGKRVIDGQLGIADEDKRKQSYLAKFMRNAAGNAENLLGQYEEEVRAEWHKERLKYLETADGWPNGRVVHAGKYDRMFEPTREKIREILTTEFPKLEASARAQETAQRGTSAETGDRTGGGAGRGTGTGTGTGPGEKRTSETSAQCTYSVCLPAAIVPLAERLSPAGLLALTLLLAVCLGGVVGAVAFRGVQRWRRG